MSHLTDAKRNARPKAVRLSYRFWLDFSLQMEHSRPSFRRWFKTLEERNAYILDLPKTCTVTQHGEEP